METLEITHQAAQRRFFVEVDGWPCELDYTLDGGRMVITHTGVPSAVGGRGIAARLTEAALEHARAQGLVVVPRCAYAVAYFERHPEHSGLLDGG